RIYINDEPVKIETLLNEKKEEHNYKNCFLIINRFKLNHKNIHNLLNDIKISFQEGGGECCVFYNDQFRFFSTKYELDGICFEKPNQYLFNFSSPFGACPKCEGYGSCLDLDKSLIIPDENLSVYENGIACWKGEKMNKWKKTFIAKSPLHDFPIFRSYNELSDKEKELLWHGNNEVKGIFDFFSYLEEKKYKIQYRVLLSRYKSKTACTECNGTRLRKNTSYVKVNNKSLPELLCMSLSELDHFFNKINLNERDQIISKKLIDIINEKLKVLIKVGVHYLSLSRDSRSLSGGETQRINLAKFLSSPLVDALYILDEPSIGLHPKDTQALIHIMRSLSEKQNTVVVVEHDEDIIRAADHVIDMGPKAGENGGEVIYSGSFDKIQNVKDSLTAQFIRGDKKIELPSKRHKGKSFINIEGAHENNLMHINITIPLNCIVSVTGVSGSGKTSLIKNIIYKGLKNLMKGAEDGSGAFKSLSYDTSAFTEVEFIDQNPIGKSSRSNPTTYIKAYDSIRKLMANQQHSKLSGFSPGHFSFNTDTGRCAVCKGAGTTTIEMQFLPDVSLTCEECKGYRFKPDILEVMYKEHNIHDILNLTVDDALSLFKDEKDISKRLSPLQRVGLGYIRLGQASSTLSGGEAQRVKLASFISIVKDCDPTLFIFDEPTTGLHNNDIIKLYDTFKLLIDSGHSIILVEHNLELIKLTDYIIDLGPGGGTDGGKLMFQGTPEGLIKNKNSVTAKYLKEKLT
ncbi:MAG TPA: excinuclease ABC subunit A, partial [Bacteroidetes bacterium]|nr:excinuclease ABC subunit A [Bacteroidota bacterium]